MFTFGNTPGIGKSSIVTQVSQQQEIACAVQNTEIQRIDLNMLLSLYSKILGISSPIHPANCLSS
jgi:hypothetical protein